MQSTRFNPSIREMWRPAGKPEGVVRAGQWGSISGIAIVALIISTLLMNELDEITLLAVTLASTPLLIATAIAMAWKLRLGVRPWRSFSVPKVAIGTLAVYGLMTLGSWPLNGEIDPEAADRARRLVLPAVALYIAFARPDKPMFQRLDDEDASA